MACLIHRSAIWPTYAGPEFAGAVRMMILADALKAG